MTMVKVSSVNVMWVWLEKEGKGPEEIYVHVNMTLKIVLLNSIFHTQLHAL